MRLGILIILLLSWQIIVGQKQVLIDSLHIKLENEVEDTGKIKLYNELAEAYYTTDLIKSLEEARSALELSTEIENDLLIVRSQMAIGRALISIGNYDEATSYFLSALKTAQNKNYLTDEIIIYTRLGVVQDRIEQFDAALEYYFKALNIYNESVEVGRSLENNTNIQGIYNNIGNIYLSKNELENAEEYYLKGLALAVNKNNNINIGIICNNLGKLELQRNNFSTSLEYLKKSLQARQDIDDKSGIAKSYYNLSHYYEVTGKLELALEYAHKSLQISGEVNEPLSAQVATMLLYNNYKKLGKSDSALYYHEIFKQLNDSLINENNIKEVTRLQLKFNYEKEEIEKEKARQKIMFRIIVIVSSLTLGLIILALLYILSKNRNKRITEENVQLGKDMVVKNKELTANVIYLLKKNELIDSITERLLNLKSQFKGENVNKLHRIILDLQSISNDDDVWKEFEYRFQNVHEEFYMALKQKYPQLTPLEIRLAAFLRLNMTTKEISSITGQSVSSLETARYRLRKKLGINNQEVNLVNFLLNI
ncbi:tetratricopeptide repeat protein [Maribellus sediminis]|uniref:tetratricopeptide repeat protein n=1 Tax=Maribellus sediminis TaxID=2696285 RepID=UPI001430CEA5|nr:tetratricopeptide repeat protein [Maribellus sediminis]